MAHFKPFRRKRRADDARYGDQDARAWRRLVKAARYQLQQPLADSKPLWAAAEACAKAVPPPGHAGRDSVFLRLVITARAFARMAPSERAAADATAESLRDLAATCEAAVNGSAPDTSRGARADIFG